MEPELVSIFKKCINATLSEKYKIDYRDLDNAAWSLFHASEAYAASCNRSSLYCQYVTQPIRFGREKCGAPARETEFGIICGTHQYQLLLLRGTHASRERINEMLKGDINEK